MAKVDILLFVFVFIGCWCLFEADNNPPCDPTLRNESFSQYVVNKNCDVDEKLLKLFTDKELFSKSVVDKPYANFMCTGFMNALTLVSDDWCDVDPLSEISSEDFCSSSKMMTYLQTIGNGGVFENNSVIVMVSSFTKQYCEAICNGNNELCWSFGIIARMAWKHNRVRITTATTAAPTTVTTTPTISLTKPDQHFLSGQVTNSFPPSSSQVLDGDDKNYTTTSNEILTNTTDEMINDAFSNNISDNPDSVAANDNDTHKDVYVDSNNDGGFDKNTQDEGDSDMHNDGDDKNTQDEGDSDMHNDDDDKNTQDEGDSDGDIHNDGGDDKNTQDDNGGSDNTVVLDSAVEDTTVSDINFLSVEDTRYDDPYVTTTVKSSSIATGTVVVMEEIDIDHRQYPTYADSNAPDDDTSDNGYYYDYVPRNRGGIVVLLLAVFIIGAIGYCIGTYNKVTPVNKGYVNYV